MSPPGPSPPLPAGVGCAGRPPHVCAHACINATPFPASPLGMSIKNCLCLSWSFSCPISPNFSPGAGGLLGDCWGGPPLDSGGAPEQGFQEGGLRFFRVCSGSSWSLFPLASVLAVGGAPSPLISVSLTPSWRQGSGAECVSPKIEAERVREYGGPWGWGPCPHLP